MTSYLPPFGELCELMRAWGQLSKRDGGVADRRGELKYERKEWLIDVDVKIACFAWAQKEGLAALQFL